MFFQTDDKQYAAVEGLRNQIDSNYNLTFGFNCLVSSEQANYNFDNKLIDVGSLVELYKQKVMLI